MRPFVHLHLHTEYSLLDGETRIKTLFGRCKELNQPAVVMTDHGNMFGAIKFFKAAAVATDPKCDPLKFIASDKPFAVKPIIGCEVYTVPDMTDRTHGIKNNHLVLLCKNERGYKNLVKMVSAGYTEGFYYKPRIDFELLKAHSEGLVCLSACLAGVIPRALLENNYAEARRHAQEFKDLFGDDFYIEIQDHGIREQRIILQPLIALARELNIKLVATNDVHYLNKEDAEIQKILQCVSFRNTLEQAAEGNEYFPTEEFYLKSGDEMTELFPYVQDAIDNTLEIAEKCDFRMRFGQTLLPVYSTPDGYDAPAYLRHLVEEKMPLRYPVVTPEIRARVDYELDVIIRMGFADYYLIVWDFIRHAEETGIPVGPGRGSGAASIVAYITGITKVDPLVYNLTFERFLNPERVSSPDFDIDFCFERRDEVIKYVREKYHESNVAQIVTFGTLAAKAAIKDIGRVLGVPHAQADKITKSINTAKASIMQSLGLVKGGTAEEPEDWSSPEFITSYKTDDMTRKIVDLASKIEGIPRNTSMHAAGVVICRDIISDHVPLQLNGSDITTQFDMNEVGELGMLKMDFLGLRTLTDIKKAVDYIKEIHGKEIDFYAAPYDDSGVYEQIAKGPTYGIFQIESAGMTRFMQDLQPTSLEEVTAGIALYRPGPMDFIPEYLRNKRNPSAIVYDAPVLEHILDVTYGVIVYQEQVMSIVREMAGYTFGRADEVRRIMSKKKAKQMEEEKQVFIHGLEGKYDGAVKRGFSEETAARVFDKMSSFAKYAFNKAHAAAYSFLTYQTAYLMHYYRVEYMTAILNNRISKPDEVKHYLKAVKAMNIKILPPDVNESYALFTAKGDSIRAGISAIKGIGTVFIKEITDERDQNGAYIDFYDFCERQKSGVLTKKMVENMIYAGVFDSFNIYRSRLLQVYESVLDRAAKARARAQSGQLSFFDMAGIVDKALDKKTIYPPIPELLSDVKLRYEKEVAGIYFSGHPLDNYAAQMSQYAITTADITATEAESDAESENFYFNDDEHAARPKIENGMRVVMGGILSGVKKIIGRKSNTEMLSATLEDLDGQIKIMLGARNYQTYRPVFVDETLVTVEGKLALREGDEPMIWVDRITEWDKPEPEIGRKLCIYYSFSEANEDFRESLNELISCYPGSDTVYTKNLDDNALYKLDVTVRADPPLLNELTGLLGENKIKLI